MRVETDFLEEIVKLKTARLKRAIEMRPISEVIEAASLVRAKSKAYALRAALRRRSGPALIAEIKRASPSKGEIADVADVAALARAYEDGGAAAISVLTEEDVFRGSLQDLSKVKAAVAVPVLRKDFIFNVYQIFESAAAGADALLLIAAALDDDELYDLRALTEDQLQMDAMVEVHTIDELRRAYRSKARLIGVNNRNLRTFEVSLEVSAKLISAAPPGITFVSESGLNTNAQIRQLRAIGYQGFLVGETLLRAGDPGTALRELIGTS